MTNPDLVSRVARALNPTDWHLIDDPFQQKHHSEFVKSLRDESIALAQAALREVLEVLKEPTGEMVEAGTDAFAEAYGTAPLDICDDREAACSVFAAMLSASPLSLGPDQ